MPLVMLALVAGCSSGTSRSGTTAGGPSNQASPTVSTGGNAACSHGLTGSETGVIRITCDGPAEIKIQAGDVTRDLHGGKCQSGGGVWSATVGVVIDETGVSAKYTGPPVEVVTVNNTNTAGKATIQAVLAGKHYAVLGTASLTLSADQKTAHAEGSSDRLSDAPGANVVVDVTCG